MFHWPPVLTRNTPSGDVAGGGVGQGDIGMGSAENRQGRVRLFFLKKSENDKKMGF